MSKYSCDGVLLDGLQQRRHFGADVAASFPPSAPCAPVLRAASSRDSIGDVIVGRGVGEEGLQPVIIGLQDRVELVIVAARAAVGQAQEDAARRVGDVVQNLLPPLLQIARIALVRIVPAEARRDPRLRTLRPQFVARDLLLHEAVVRLIAIQRIDHVIAIAPGVRPRFVALEALALRVARQVEPVPSPALAVLRRCQQAIHHLRERIRRLVGDKRIDFGRRRRQSDQVERRAPQQRDLVRGRPRRDRLRLQFRRDEAIDIGVRTHAAFFTAGGVCGFTFWNDQNSRCRCVKVSAANRAAQQMKTDSPIRRIKPSDVAYRMSQGR